MNRILQRTVRTFLVCSFFMFSTGSFAQKPDTLIKKLDSLQKSTDTTGKQVNNTAPAAFNENTVMTPSAYFVLLGSNIKQAFTKPFHMQKKDIRNAVTFVLLEVGLSFADKPIQRNALDLRNNNIGVGNLSDYVTRFGGTYEIYTLLGLGAESFIFKNQKLKTTTLLATQAYLTGGAVETAVKFLSGRQRPTYYDVNAPGPTGRFRGPFASGRDINGNKVNSSFPSGHTTVAFAAATVFAMEYKNKPLIPIISYTAATLIGLSRITENKHWLTDVLAGAALGFLSGQQVVNNYHRYQKIRSGVTAKNKGSLHFNLDYSMGAVMPGAIYKFR